MRNACCLLLLLLGWVPLGGLADVEGEPATEDAAPADPYVGLAVITVGHGRLEPALLEVRVGEWFVFHNVDHMPGGHMIVESRGRFTSPALRKDERWKTMIGKPGVYEYSIRQHPEARGKIIAR